MLDKMLLAQVFKNQSFSTDKISEKCETMTSRRNPVKIFTFSVYVVLIEYQIISVSTKLQLCLLTFLNIIFANLEF